MPCASRDCKQGTQPPPAHRLDRHLSIEGYATHALARPSGERQRLCEGDEVGAATIGQGEV